MNDPDPHRPDLERALDDPRPEHARIVHDHILELGHARSYPELYELALDDRTDRVLALLPETQRFRAGLVLSEAHRWADSKRRTAARRLAEAGRALDRLDVELARGLLARIDDRHLDPALSEERDALLLAVSARTMEVEELAELADRVVDEERPPRRRRRWWRRDG